MASKGPSELKPFYRFTWHRRADIPFPNYSSLGYSLRFYDSMIPKFYSSVILSSYHSLILWIYNSTILPLCNSVILWFYHSTILWCITKAGQSHDAQLSSISAKVQRTRMGLVQACSYHSSLQQELQPSASWRDGTKRLPMRVQSLECNCQDGKSIKWN